MVSVIIINYNTFKLTHACISSVYALSADETVEIILVDNASTEMDVDELTKDFPELIIIKNQENLGYAKANNIGIETAKGDYILLLNSDAELKNNAIGICKDVLIKHPDTGIVTAQLSFPDGRIQNNCQSFPSIKNELIELTRFHKVLGKSLTAKIFRGSFFNHQEDCYCDWIWGAFFMFRRDDLNIIPEKKLSDTFFMYGEDMEWCYQFRLAGLKTFYASKAKVLHHLGGSDFGNNEKKLRQIIINELSIIKKYKGSFYVLIIRILRFVKYKILSIKDSKYSQIAQVYRRPFQANVG